SRIDPKAHPTRSQAASSPASNFTQRTERTGHLASRCPACGDPDLRVLFEVTDRLYQSTTKVFRVVECRACRLVRLDPWPSPENFRDITRKVIGSIPARARRA